MTKLRVPSAVVVGCWMFAMTLLIPVGEVYAQELAGQIVDTGQDRCFDTAMEIECPDPGAPFFGQDAQHQAAEPAYSIHGDGTVTDLNTGLMWTQTPDLDGNGIVDAADKLTYEEALKHAAAASVGGHRDWRVPTIQELYSLMDFRGEDISGPADGIGTGSHPFLDIETFGFGYGDASAGERLIDAQFASATLYTGTTMGGNTTMFGVNFADGRIKGYPAGPTPVDPGGKGYYLLLVRGMEGYGESQFKDNGDGTVTDLATGLMWAREDSGSGMNWQDALAWVQERNGQAYLGHTDWRLPNAKELHSLVDYARSPDATGSAAIDPIFSTTEIVNEAGDRDFPAFWTGTTHINQSETPGGYAVYISFGRAMGYLRGRWTDVHGAGAQRSDPKAGDPSRWPTGHGPQGDAIRINNFVRLVRGGNTHADSQPSVGDSPGTLQGSTKGDAVNIHYLEIVTPDVDGTCHALEEIHGVSFGEPIVDLGGARTASLSNGGRIGVRAPMRETEEPVVRPYVLVEDIETAVEAARAAGGEIAMLPTEIAGQGTFAIYILGGIQHGLWQL